MSGPTDTSPPPSWRTGWVPGLAGELLRWHGFALVDEHMDTSWGAPMREQRYVRVGPDIIEHLTPTTAYAP